MREKAQTILLKNFYDMKGFELLNKGFFQIRMRLKERLLRSQNIGMISMKDGLKAKDKFIF
jgi:hypothetical protein